MTLIEQALMKVQGQYPVMDSKPLWTIREYDETTNTYPHIVKTLSREDLVSSSISVKSNDAGETTLSIMEASFYMDLCEIFQTTKVIFVRETVRPQWFVLDSMSVSREVDEDSGVETWSYNIGLLDGISILQYILLPNNRYVTVPSGKPADGYELPENYMKFSLGTGTEVSQSYIYRNMINRPLYTGVYPNVSTERTSADFTLDGLTEVATITPDNPYYSEPKTSWVNTECGEVMVLEKITDLNYNCPILTEFRDEHPFYEVCDSPNLLELEEAVDNTVTLSYTGGFQHAENQSVFGSTGSIPSYSQIHHLASPPTIYSKWGFVKEDIPDEVDATEGKEMMDSAIFALRANAHVTRFLDTQLSTVLKPWDNFNLGDVLRINLPDVEGFGVTDLVVTEISEAIEDDAITYTLTLEEMEN